MTPSKSAILLALAGVSLYPLLAALDSTSGAHAAEVDRSGYVSDENCSPCHKNISQSYQHNGHHLTSQLPTATSVLGSFAKGSNSLTIVDRAQSARPELQFLMEPRKEGLFETARTGWGTETEQSSERIALVTGSGVRGQTYLYWQGDQLFELPVSYWTDGHRWINSPGYIDGTADFSRVGNPACMECPASYIRALSDDPGTNRYERASLIVGISCESCHGPGADHVRLETKHETDANKSSPHGILNPANFPRDRKIDLCAECHNG